MDQSENQRRVALITGITGQDGSYLAEFLLEEGYDVHGIVRQASHHSTGKIQHLYENPHSHKQGKRLVLHYGDMTDSGSLVRILGMVKPTEVYNLAAQSQVDVSYKLAEYTVNVNAVGVVRLLDAIRACGLEKSVKFYQASTSQMYGQASQVPQDEKTPFRPQSPYACSKLCSYWLTVNHRETYEMFACNGILFNHESPRRGENYVTRKITRAVVKIHLGLQEVLELGNLYARRDWGHAKDYVRAMWLMLQQETPDDYVIATGHTRSVKEFVQEAFRCLGKIIIWEGHGIKETGRDYLSERVIVRINPRYFRPTDVELLQGNASKAIKKLGWEPTISFEDLVAEMVEEDLMLMNRDPRA